MPLAGTVSSLNLGVLTSTNGSGSSDNAAILVYHNGSATSMTCTATTAVASGSKGSCSTTSNTFTVVAGDTLSLRLTESNFGPIYQYASSLKCQ